MDDRRAPRAGGPAHRLGLSVVVGLGVAALASNLATLAPSIRRNLRFVSTLRATSIDERVDWQWGDLSRLLRLVRNTTPPGSTILIPQRYPELTSVWQDVGNVQIVRSFLHPREILPISEADWRDHWSRTSRPDVFAIVVSRESGGRRHLWPPRGTRAGWRILHSSSGWGVAAPPPSSR